MKQKITCILLALLFCCGSIHSKRKPIRIACIGNSITYGYGIANREKNSYPAQLQAYLGERYEVRNFGVSGTTLLNKGDRPYTQTTAYKNSLEYRPDIVLIKLGTNDAKPRNWAHKANFTADYQALIDSYRNQKPAPRIILLTPLRCFLTDANVLNAKLLEEEISPLIEKVAEQNQLEIIRLTPILGDGWNATLLPDRLHPSSIGAGMIAEYIGRHLLPQTGKASTHAVPGNEFRSGAGWAPNYEWHGVAEDIKETLTGKELELLLLGNSITQGWGGNRKAVTYKPGKAAMDEQLGTDVWESAGISGDRTQNLLWRIRHDNYNSCHPKNVVIAIGINNLIAGNDTPEDVAEGLIAVSNEARRAFPNSRIFLLGVLPSGKEKQSAIRMKCDKVHELLAAHRFKRVTYVNLTDCFLDAEGRIRDGLYIGDYIHLTAEGYNVLAREIKGLIRPANRPTGQP